MDGIQMNEKLTSAEVGKLWATYMGNSMSKCVLSYYLNHVDDKEIKKVLEKAMNLSEQFTQTIKEMFTKENHPVPVGFTPEDVNVEAPRLFADEFYLHYLKYVAKAALSLYAIAVPLMTRPDVRHFFTDALQSGMDLMNDMQGLLISKGLLIKPPYIPMPKQVDFVKKDSYLNGFFGDVRPLHALEIAHLYDNLENNATSRCVLTGFAQVAQSPRARDYFIKGEQLSDNHIEVCTQFLYRDDLPAQPQIAQYVTDCTFPPFSDKIMLFHKIDMFSMRIRTYANSMAVNGRHDLSVAYAKFLLDVGTYIQDGAKIMIDNGWMEQPPQAADRDALVLK